MIHPPPEAFVRATELERTHLESRESSPALRILAWAAAGLLTLGVHVGLYLALTRQAEVPPTPSELPAAVMIDMSPEPTVAKSETDNAAEGPPAADSEATPESEPVEEAPPPPDVEPVVEAPPPPPEVKPQAVLPPTPPKPDKKPNPKPPEKKLEKKPVEKKPEKTVEKKERPKPASRSGGGPRSDQQNADRTAASAAGSAVSQASRATWQNEMRARIVRAKRFPPGATGATGLAVVSATFTGTGGVTGVRLVASSGNAALDGEAVAVVYRAAPYPPPPGGQALMQTIPVNFNRR